jgi:hypothetical protein
MTGRERAGGACSGAVATDLLSATRLRRNATYFRNSSPQVRLNSLSQRCCCHVAIGTISRDAKVCDACRRIKPHQFNGECVNAKQGSHPVERGSDAILNLTDGATAATAKCAHQRKLKRRAGEALCAVRSGAGFSTSVDRFWSVAAKKTACSLDYAMADFFERTGYQRAGGARVPTTAEFARELVHVHIAGAAKRHFHFSVAQIAEEQRQPGARDRPGVFGNPIEIFGPEPVVLSRASLHRHPGNSVLRIHFESGEGVAQ